VPVTRIGDNAFAGNKAVTSVYISDNVTHIGGYAFCNTSLVSVTLGSNVSHIDAGAFQENDSLVSVSLNDGLLSIGNAAFYYCSSLISVTIPDSVNSIGDSVFYGCSSMTKCVLPNSILSIPEQMFRECTSLLSISIPDSVEVIKEGAFKECSKLTSVKFSDSLVNINNGAFEDCYSISSLSLPSNLQVIGGYVFKNCYKLTSIKLPDSLISMGEEAFRNCTSLLSISFPKELTIIPNYAFTSCSSLKNISFNDNLNIIGAHAFCGCSEISSVEVPESVIYIDAYGLGYREHQYWEDCYEFKTEDFVIYGKSGTCAQEYADSNGFVFNEIQESTLEITSQPVNVTVTEGETAKFSVAASGSDLKYQWYWKSSTTDWAASTGTGYNTNTLSVSAEMKRNGYQYYCKVTDASGKTVDSTAAKLTVKQALAISNQPTSVTVTEGETAKFTVTAAGTGLKYQWYWKSATGDWAASTGTGYNTNTLSVSAEMKRNGYQYYCKVTDANGKTVDSTVAKLTVKQALAISKQPASVTVTEGETVKFTVTAAGTGLKYQWYWKSATSDWAASTGTGYNTNTLSVSAEMKRNGYQYYCKVTDANGKTVDSTVAKLTVKQALAISKQPASVTVTEGETAKFTVTAAGTGLKYQWYWKAATGDWAASTGTGYNTNTLSVSAEMRRNGYQYYCKVTDANGKTVDSIVAKLTIKQALTISKQPASVTVTEGETAKFTVTAAGTGLKYQWYWKSATSDWAASTGTGYNTNTLSVSAEMRRNGYQYYCKVTDANGKSINSTTAKLNIKEALKILKNPADVTAVEGDTVKFSISTNDQTATYQWYWRSDEKDTWKVSSLSGNNTSTLNVPVTAARNGYQYRCVAKTNKTVTSQVATLKTLYVAVEPQNITAKLDSIANFIAIVNSSNASYQWYWRSNSSSDWAESTMFDCKTPVLKVFAAASRNGYQYRCVITDVATGKKITTKEATLKVI